MQNQKTVKFTNLQQNEKSIYVKSINSKNNFYKKIINSKNSSNHLDKKFNKMKSSQNSQKNENITKIQFYGEITKTLKSSQPDKLMQVLYIILLL